ncbi:hypothetical protein FQZ97_1088330 [compost metagenome]
MNPEKRIFVVRIQLFIEFQVIFICELSGRFYPYRTGVIDGLLSEFNRGRKEFPVFGKNLFEFKFLQEFFGIFGNVEDHVCTSFSSFCG